MKHILLLLPFLSLFTYGQNRIATPQITHYRSQDYRAGMQNWDVEQDAAGILYFGNNEGLLTFNGRYWSVHPLPNRTVVRSVEIDAANRIFVGAQDELGYFFPDEQGILRYHSLLPLLPPGDRSFNDVWNIVVNGKDVFFQSLRQIMRYRDGKMTVYKSASAWAYLGQAGAQVFGQERGRGLFRFSGNDWQMVCRDSLLVHYGMTGILPASGDELLVTTLKKGLFLLKGSHLSPLKTTVDEALKADRVYCALSLGANRYALGTSSAGVFLIDGKGSVLERYTAADGLQSSNIRGLWLDNAKNLWLGLDDGIDHVAVNSPIQHLSPGGNAAGYSLAVYRGKLYAGMSSGLFAAALSGGALNLAKGTFHEIESAKGQIWNLDVVNDQLLMGHENGLYRIENEQVSAVYFQPGTWLVRSYAGDDWLAGTYQGLKGLSFRNGRFLDRGLVGNVREPLRFLVTAPDSQTVWSSHPIRGVFRFQWDPASGRVLSSELLTDRDGLPSARYNYVYKIRGKMVVATEKGVFEYRNGRFEREPLLTGMLGDMPLQYLRDDHLGNVWFASDKRLGYVDFRRKKDPVVYFPELSGRLVGGFEFILPVDEENVFVGSDKGFFYLDYRKYRQETRKPSVLLGQIRVTGGPDSVVFGGYLMKGGWVSAEQGEKLVLAAGLNSLHFEFSSPALQNTAEYSYQLEGFDKGWSAWNPKPEKDYTGLPWGRYVFLVKARNNFGNESAVLKYEIEIRPAWYEGYLARLAYALLTGGFVYWLFRRQRRKHVRKQQQLQYLHQLEMDRSEKEIVRLKNEKLEAEMDFKNRELATMTMQLVQRGEILVKVKEVVSSWVKKQDTKDSALSFRQVLRLIRDVESKDADWGQFALHFNTVNEELFLRLKEQYPELTPNDLKLCAFLKMNLSSKEIARLMNVTVKAIEVGRYRLRKKLQLPPEANLYEFLSLEFRV